MAKKKEYVKESKESPVVSEVTAESDQEKYDRLTGEIRSKLMPNSRLITGGAGVRGKYSNEVSAFTPVLEEINELGKKLGKPPVGLGHLRG